MIEKNGADNLTSHWWMGEQCQGICRCCRQLIIRRESMGMTNYSSSALQLLTTHHKWYVTLNNHTIWWIPPFIGSMM